MQTAATRRRRGRLAWIAAALTAGIAGVFSSAALAAPGVTPQTVTDDLLPGESVTIGKSVETPEIPPKPDIFFLADSTGSMGGAIANVRANAASIMNQVLAAQPDAQFAVGEYKDVASSAFVYRLNQAMTASTTDVQNGINQWAATGGGDEPEAQLFALQELSTNPATGFRAGSSRIVVWFGDAPGHDPSNGATEASATAALVAAGVRVIAISTGANRLDLTGQATRITAATGGVFLPGASDTEVANAILAGLSNLPATVTHSVTCPSGSGVSVTLTPASQTVTSGGSVSFSETYGAAATTAAGTYVCTVDFLINGLAAGPAFRETITLNVNRPPDCASATTGLGSLWPPNHKLVHGQVTVTDPDGDVVSVTISKIEQDEPVEGRGDGNTAPDAQIGANGAFAVRAERDGRADGRVYRISFSAADTRGGSCTGTLFAAVVPHDQGNGSTAVNSAPPWFDSTLS